VNKADICEFQKILFPFPPIIMTKELKFYLWVSDIEVYTNGV